MPKKKKVETDIPDDENIDKLLKDLSDWEEAGNMRRIYEPVCWLPSGSLMVDRAFGGGFPRGAMTMLSGKKGYGKTSLCILAAARTVRDGGRVVVIDTEHKWESGYIQKCGLLPDDKTFFHIQPYSLEAVGQILRRFSRAKFDMVIIDSIVGSAPRAEIEGTLDDGFMMQVARLLARLCRNSIDDIARNNTAVIVTNQARDTIGYGVNRPGGNALKHQMMICADILLPEPKDKVYVNEKEKEKLIGFSINGKTYENSAAPNHQSFDVPVRLSPYLMVDRAGEIVDMAQEFGIVTKRDGSRIYSTAAAYFYKGAELGMGRDNAKMSLVEKPELALELEGIVREFIKMEVNGEIINALPDTAEPVPEQ